MKNICIVIQGPSNHVKELKNAWADFNSDIVFSTWKTDDLSNYEKTDNVILNEFPENSGIRNLNLQKISTKNGIEYAKNLGYSKILKIRSDMIPINAKKFIDIFDEDNFYVLSWINHNHGYYTDYFMCSDVSTMEFVWDFDGTVSCEYPEQVITDRIKKINKPILECYFKMNEENDLYWIKLNKWTKQSFCRF